MKTWIFLALLVLIPGMTARGQETAKLRTQRDTLVEKGRWREALTLYEEKLLPVKDSRSAQDWLKAGQCLEELGEWKSFDALMERAVAEHPDDADVLTAVADTLDRFPHSGRILAGEFERGQGEGFYPGYRPRGRGGFLLPGRGAGGGFSCEYRDRIRSLQLLRQAAEKAQGADKQAAAWRELGQRLVNAGAPWELQVLTPLDALPAWDEQGPEGGTEGAPWAGDGPVVYGVPASWDAAKNDGERWRFSLAEAARLVPALQAELIWERAEFARGQFGLSSLESYGWRMRNEAPDRLKGLLAAETLADDECLAQTSDGVKRFKLPADQHFIALLRSILDDKARGGNAGDTLVAEYLDRGQFDRAVAMLREVIEKHGPGDNDHRKESLKQITGNWARLGGAATVAAGHKPVLPVEFRNAKKIQFTAAPLDMGRVLADLKTYLKGNPQDIDYDKVTLERIGERLIEQSASNYVGETAASWELALTPEDKYRTTRTQTEVPLDRAGAWWITGKVEDGNTVRTLVWITDTTLVRRDHDGKAAWWVVDAATGAPVPGATVEFFGYRFVSSEKRLPNGRRGEVKTKELTKVSDEQGKVLLGRGDLDNQYQWLTSARKDGRATAFTGFEGFYVQNRNEDDGVRQVPYGVSDRPMYRPGDAVHVKFWLREASYDEINETKWGNQTGRIVFTNGRGEEVAKLENRKTDAFGAVEGDLTVPKDAVLGNWIARFEIEEKISAGVSFRVEEYRKPEYEVTVEAPKEPVRLGDKFTATVKALYFHGAPVRNATVEITVNRESLGERWFPVWGWDWLYGRGAWWCGTEAAWHPGWSKWGCIPPPPPWWRNPRWTPAELVIKRTVPIGEDGTAKIEVDTAPAKETHGDMDARYSITAKVVDASRREETASGAVTAARKPFEIVVWTTKGHVRPGEETEAVVSAATLEGKPVAGAKGTLRLLKLSVGDDGSVQETEVNSWPAETNADGELRQRFQSPEVGQYRLSATLSLNGGEATEGGNILNVFGPGKVSDGWRFGAIELVPDKSSYAAGETLKLRVNSDRAGARVVLFIRNGARSEVRDLVLDGKSTEVSVALERGDMPNFFIEAFTVFDAEVHSAVRQILLPPENRMLEVTVEPAKTKVKPQEKSSVAIIVKNTDGKPFNGTATLAIYDKSLEVLAGGSNVPAIRDAFWSWKRSFWSRIGGHFPQSPGNLVKDEDPRMINLSGLERMLQGGGFQGSPLAGIVTGGFRSGDGRISRNNIDAVLNNPNRARSMSKMAAPASPMMAEAASDAFAGGGGGAPEAPQIAVRSDFADLLKWVGEVKTDANGRAEIPLEFPDNLTTWKARVWALGAESRVGEGSAEIVTSKELLVRLQAPRFLVEKDEAVLSAVVHNEHATVKSVTVSLELAGGTVEAIDGAARTIDIAPKGEARIDWRVKAVKEGEATIRMKVAASDDGDAMERKIPVLVHGMLRQDAWSRVVEPGSESAVIEVDVPEQRRPEQSKLTVRFSPTVAGAVVDSIPYLADYPYGCTEQTLNRFVPAAIAGRMLKDLGIDLAQVREKRNNLNPQELGNAEERAAQWKRWQRNPVFDEEEMNRMISAGLDKLGSMQNSDGGWGWFSGYGEQSWPHTTAVVVHGLLTAKAAGREVPQPMIDSGASWLEGYEKQQLAAMRRYAQRAAAEKAGKKLPPSNLPEKEKSDAMDAFVRMVLGEAGKGSDEMLGALHRDRLSLPVYAQCLVGLELQRVKDSARRDEVMATIAQYLKRDDENQTNYLDLKNESYWWYWYGGNVEAHAWYLKLLAAVNPKSQEARGLVKYLVNNRKHASYWDSTRDTAYAVEAIAAWFKASGESAPSMEVEVLVDGKSLKKVAIDKENLFAFDGTVVLSGNEVTTGKHKVELRRKGEGALYANAYLEVFSLEDFLRKAGLEVKVERHVFKLVPEESETAVPDSKGQVVKQRVEKFRKVELKDGDTVASGDRLEVELVLESKNDYEYLIFSDGKPAGFEAEEALSGYVFDGITAYMEPRDRTVDFFIRALPRGKSQVSYRLRAEAPGYYHALPATAAAMYAPELRGNSDEIRLNVK